MKLTDIYIHPSSIVENPKFIGGGTKVWHFSHIMNDVSIGQNCIIGQNVFIANNVILGDNVKVQNNVSIYDGVICEDNVFLGPSMVFTNVINPRSYIQRKNEFKPTIVRKGATIGANATIVCGNEIGEYAMIGAGSVITKPVKKYALIVGNPGKQIGWVSEVGNRISFEKDSVYGICPESKSKYILQNNELIKL